MRNPDSALSCLLACAIFLAGCRTDPAGSSDVVRAVVEGKVTRDQGSEAGDPTPVEGARVEIVLRRLLDGACLEELEPGGFTETITDALGEYDAVLSLLGKALTACVDVTAYPPRLSALWPETEEGVVEFREGEPGRARVDILLCRPPRIESAIVFGTVSSEVGVPVPQADVEILGLIVNSASTPVDTVEACIGVRDRLARTVTDQAGFYRDELPGAIGLEACLVVTAQADGRRGVASGDTVELRVDRGTCTAGELDSVRVDVVLDE